MRAKSAKKRKKKRQFISSFETGPNAYQEKKTDTSARISREENGYECTHIKRRKIKGIKIFWKNILDIFNKIIYSYIQVLKIASIKRLGRNNHWIEAWWWTNKLIVNTNNKNITLRMIMRFGKFRKCLRMQLCKGS